MYTIFSLISTITLVILFLHIRINREILEIILDNMTIMQYYNYFRFLFCLIVCVIIYFILVKTLAETKKWWLLFQQYNIFFRTYSVIFDYTIYLVKYAQKFIEYSRKKNIVIICMFVMLPRLIVILKNNYSFNHLIKYLFNCQDVEHVLNLPKFTIVLPYIYIIHKNIY